MNILYHFRTRGTGAEGVHIAGIANALRQLGHEVDFSSPTGVDPTLTAGANPFLDAGRGGLVSKAMRLCPDFAFEVLEIVYNLFAYVRNRRLLQGKNYDLIYERHAFFLFSTAFLASRFNIPLAIEVNELVGDARIRKQPMLKFVAYWTDRYVFRRCSLIIVVSPHLKRRIVEQGIKQEKILVLPNAVTGAAHNECAKGEDARRRCGFGNDDIVVGFVGWLVHWHRLEDLLECIADLAAEYSKIRLMLVGAGPLQEKLEEMAVLRHAAERLVITGAIAHDHVPEHIAAMDIAVIPYSNEYRSPIKLFEYMVQERAVVAVRTEPIEMVITHGHNGLLFKPDGNIGMKKCIRDLIENEELRRNLGRRARIKVLESHTWTANAEKILHAVKK